MKIERVLLLSGLVLAQKPYFQQRVEYFIKVTLYPQEHMLRGHIRIVYTNNSPDTLWGLYFHLWPNAYTKRGTPFDLQQRGSMKSRFYFASREERGFIDSLDFLVEGMPVKPLPAHKGPQPAKSSKLSLLRRAPDVIWLPLPKPLPPKGTIEIQTPFRVRIPITFSRMGRSEVQYQITQWYPKPAVYDREGWHPLPYLDSGEFYSEWGKYEVEISVPKNFVVGATGVLQNAEEWDFLGSREAETRKWIATQPLQEEDTLRKRRGRVRIVRSPSLSKVPLREAPEWSNSLQVASQYKTLKYVQDSIHDFAWFTDPRYGVLTDTVVLPNGHRVLCIALFRLNYYSAWRHAPRYIAEVVVKLSEWVGSYPYTHATAVEGGLAAGGGMEYPMITVIVPTTDTATLRQIILHEIGHNWFQGMLASNERRHPWQDEGINSFYENRMYYESSTFFPQSDLLGIAGYPGRRLTTPIIEQVFYHHLNADVAPSEPSEKHSPISYALGVYEATANALRAFVYSVGEESWDKGMQSYYRNWAFKHPSPSDWIESLEAAGVPSTRTIWRFLHTDREYNLKLKFKRLGDTLYKIELRETGGLISPPFFVGAVALSKDEWIVQEYRLPIDSPVVISLPRESKVLIVNPMLFWYERQVGDNFFFNRPLFRGWKQLRLSMGAPLRLPQAHVTHLNFLPVGGYNYRDGLMAGILLFHGVFPKRIGEFHFMPLYSFMRQAIRGSSGITLRSFPNELPLQLLEGRVRTSNFAGFWRTKASIEATFRRRYDFISWRHVFRLRTYLLAYENEVGRYKWENKGMPAYVALDWEGRRQEAITNLYGFFSAGHDLQGHLRIEAEGQFTWRLLKKWTVWARAYGGWTSQGTAPYLLFRPSGFDPFGEAILLDRFRESSNRIMLQQIPESQGGWRTPTDTTLSTSLLAVNLELPLPILQIIALRIDGGYFPGSKKTYSGLSIGLPTIRIMGRHVAGLYFPFWGDTFRNGKPSSFSEVLRAFTWSIQIPLDMRWAIPW
ncbi:MAG: M1 family metallopeptidase [Bacteroidia bacterium]|nr:M1 family metallopeptidase [Bacteroidia bacterium]MDW8134063.1 M1 family metallopeptidase [Bacteroidia bacterium]